MRENVHEGEDGGEDEIDIDDRVGEWLRGRRVRS